MYQLIPLFLQLFLTDVIFPPPVPHAYLSHFCCTVFVHFRM